MAEVIDPTISSAADDISVLCNRLAQNVSIAKPLVFSKEIHHGAKDTYAGNAIVYLRQSMVEAIVANLFRLLNPNTSERGLGRMIDLLENEIKSPGKLTQSWIQCRKEMYKDPEPESYLTTEVSKLRNKFDDYLGKKEVVALRAFRDEEVAHFLHESRKRKKLSSAGISIEAAKYQDLFGVCAQSLRLGSEAYLLGTLASHDFGPAVYRYYAKQMFEQYFGLTEDAYDSLFEGDEPDDWFK